MKKTILFGSASLRKPVWQVFSAASTSAFFAFFTVLSPAAFAARSVELSDSELDGVYAEGFSVSLDFQLPQQAALANLPKAPNMPQTPGTNTITKAGTGAPSIPGSQGNNINSVMVSDQSQKFLNSFININAAGSIVPVMVNLMVNVQSTVQNAVNNNFLHIENLFQMLTSAAAPPVTPPSLPPVTPPVVTPPVVTPPGVTLPGAGSPGLPDPGPGLPDLIPLSSGETAQTSSNSVPEPAPLVNGSTNSNVPENSQPPATVFETLAGTSGGNSVVEPQNSNPAPEALTSVGDSMSPLSNPEPVQTLSVEPVVDASSAAGAADPAPQNVQPVQPVNLVSPDPVSGTGTVETAATVQTLPTDAGQSQISVEPVSLGPSDAVQSPAVTGNVDVQAPLDPGSLSGGTSLIDSPVVNAPEVTAPQVSTPDVNLSPVSPSTASGMNLVVVGNQAQQYLSSFVNVNSAGSVVPVLINLVININSTVQNIANNNQFKLEDHYHYKV